MCVDVVESGGLAPSFLSQLSSLALCGMSVAILKCQILVVLVRRGRAGKGDANCHCNVCCDSVQSPSLPPNLQVIQHDSIGEALHETCKLHWQPTVRFCVSQSLQLKSFVIDNNIRSMALFGHYFILSGGGRSRG